MFRLRIITFGLVSSFLMASFWLQPIQPTQATDFDPNYLISDADFINSNTMTESQIQQFLVAQGSGLATISPSRLGSSKRAATIIYEAAQEASINPAVLLVTLQKEQSLLTTADPSQYALDRAAGFNVPDVLGTQALYSFEAQLKGADGWMGAAKWYRDKYNKKVGPGSYVCCSGSFSVQTRSWQDGNSDIRPQSVATALLYRYTPYVYNGNYNFFTLYQRYLPYFNPLSFYQKGRLVVGDFNGDGKAEPDIFYDHDNALAALWSFPTTSGSAVPTVAYSTNAGDWDASRNGNIVSGDFNGDGKQDFATLYDYSRNTMSIWVFLGDGAGNFTRSVWYASGAGNWSVQQTSKLAAGDFNGDGKTDLAVLYDYGNSMTNVWVFQSNGSAFVPSVWHQSGVGNWNANQTSVPTAGDFNGDGKADLAVFYNYGGGMTNAWVFQSDGSTFSPSVWYASGAGRWDGDRTSAPAAGDFNGDGKTDLAAFYDYGGGMTNAWVFQSDGSTFSPSVWYASGAGNWNGAWTTAPVAGDTNGDGKSDLSVIYSYGNRSMNLFTFTAGASSFTPQSVYSGGQ